MSLRPPLVVFSDLDGTLLDHGTYSWSAAQPALAALSRLGAPVVLASSKTAPEIAQFQRDMGLTDFPAIVENGAGVTGIGAQNEVPEYDALRSALDRLDPALRRNFEGFGDMDIAGIIAATGLSAQAAKLARMRSFSEPGLWHGSPSALDAFITALAPAGISARQGGRFVTLSFGKTKADRMAQLIARYSPVHTLALGDAPNDAEMLERADFGIIVANPHGPDLPTMQAEHSGSITRTTLPGPAGWNAAVLGLVKHLNLSVEQS